ncbi:MULTISPECIES: hypothetical protein [Marinobacter]|nr:MULTISPECIES: hypothetical protein [Marinobacter]
MGRSNRISGKGCGVVRAWLMVLCVPVVAVAGTDPGGDALDDAAAFDFRERSTMETIPFVSMHEESLANTAIEGGLVAPAEGVAIRAKGDDDFYLDPLALQPRDSRTDLGRSEIPVDIRFRNPPSIPGQTHSNNYLIRPPENRNYETLNTTLTGR